MLTSSLGWTGYLRSHDAAGHLDGPVGDDLVGVHVGLRAAAGLPDAQGEVVVEQTLGHLAGGGDDQRRPSPGHLAQVGVDLGRRLLQDADGPDQGLGHAVVADREVVQ